MTNLSIAMIVFTCAFLSFISLSCAECSFDYSSPQYTKEARLGDHLRMGHRLSKHAKKTGNNPVPVSLRFLLKKFQFYNDEEVFTLHSWAFLTWQDDWLKWEPANYAGLDSILLDIGHIWTPKITFDNELFYQDRSMLGSPIQCQILHTGSVTCIPKVVHTVTCNSVLTNWPYDTQTCTFNYTTLDNVRLTYPGTKGVSALGAEYGTGWTIMDYQYTPPEELNRTMSLTLRIERTAELLAAIDIVPLIITAVLSVVALVLDVRSIHRLSVQCFCLACDFELMLTVNGDVPTRGHGTPTVLIFLRSSIFLTGLSIAATIAVQKLRKRAKPPPPWVILINDFVLKDSRHRFIWPKWKAECHEDETTKKALEDWNCFSYVLNFFLLVTYVGIYFILFIVYIPSPLPIIV